MPLSEALQEAPGSLGTVRNAVLLLQLLGEGPAYQQLTDLAERSGLSVPTVHRLLRSMVLADLVEQDPRSSRYGLGPELTRLSHRYLARLPVLGALSPYLAQVRDAVGATVHVQVLVRSSVVGVDRVDGPQSGVFRDPHAVLPALASAGGRLLVARGDDEQWKAALSEADDATRVLADDSRDAWAAAGSLVAAAVEPGGHVEVAVPVLDAGGVTLAALVVDLPVGASDAQVTEAVAHLRRAVTAAMRTLGHG
jgi:IclR family acetate operon transcriptional repressor